MLCNNGLNNGLSAEEATNGAEWAASFPTRTGSSISALIMSPA